ncbi:metallothionein-like protein 3A [Phragmites australis]|uniref:metallothionein-like protein 3A n=1 Tax=Phragmites australis TaxID=29695 RepID=UPI002D7847C9|nr:metallothionein-like protein 3A [Phragmites australis]
MAPHQEQHEHKAIHFSSTTLDRFKLGESATMSDKCGNCDCADKTQCVKKGNSYGVVVVDTESRFERREEAVTAENDGCKCGSSCSCTNCTCGK